MSRMLARSSLALAIALLLASQARALVAGAWQPPPAAASAPADVKDGCQKADQLYSTREQGNNAQAVVDLLRKLVGAHPDSADVQWRLCRAIWWQSDMADSNKDQKKKLALAARDACDAALKADPNNVEAKYFRSLSIGSYSHAVSIFTALAEGLEGKFRDPLLAMTKTNPDIDNGGLWNALGRYKYELPWPKRDYDQSVKWLDRALQVFPADLRGRVYLADTLAARDDDGDKARAQKLLGEVLHAKVGQYDTAEELYAQKLARETIKRLGWNVQ